MRKIYKIAMTELSTLFYSPIAWLILVIFTVQASMTYLNLVGIMLQQQFSRPLWYSIAKEMLTGSFGIFPNMLSHLYLYIPLLTMGLMSREYSSGSIKLLYSSPVSNLKIVLGKYLSMLIYGLIFIGILSILLFFTSFYVPNFDIPLLLSGFFGVYLVICAYAAIGLFMSCLTSYQVVAAIATLAVLAFLNYVGSIGQDIVFVRDITYWLSISGRSDKLIEGLLSSGDIIYFLIVIVLFLSFSVMQLQLGKRRQARSIVVGKYLIIIFLALFMGYITSRSKLDLTCDVSSTRMNSLNPVSEEIMQKMKGGLTITTYVNLLDSDRSRGLPSAVNKDKENFEKYIRFKPDIKMKYVYYYADAGDKYLNELFPDLDEKQLAWKVSQLENLPIEKFLPPEEIKKHIDLSGEDFKFVRQIERESGEKTFLRIYEDSYVHPRENEISVAMKRLVTPVPRVAFLKGHGERSIERAGDRDYYTFARSPKFRYSLINNGFDVEELELSTCSSIPEEIHVLIIADINEALLETELVLINQYVERGGNLVIIGEPGKQELLNPLVFSLGVRFMSGTLVQPTGAYDDNLLLCQFTEEGVGVMSAYAGLRNKGYMITMPGTAALSYETDRGYMVTPVLKTNDRGSWNELETRDFVDEKATLNPKAGEVEGAYPTMLALTRAVGDREQRIVVLGDADCISNAELLMSRVGMRTANFSLITGMFRWLSNNEYPLVMKNVPPKDTVLQLTQTQVPWLKVIFMWIFPALFIFGYIVIWVKRKRR